ncbi:MAG: hydroxymethylglutaryl-CoA lyase [Cyclobacteriaceae bacterium]|nr:hydroxymethylglutaryl-CoA lyase [Cyclobacteriaceae bacterium]MCB0500497.1 hydroxymethylglutaryl-CoA lyase [Cyclobacteriaceae bacterium]MCB9238480.1 hydroxymethylglutaryl-CoA lyase [Flammeovirgaceae bacterium]MCO5271427.1 hydroxymethylglutaryl-CoA lyase [Cyclobacteriaceae bacterium]MCW5903606.1 hydroxymethylglutaryl-CoA lyase [Cyclobacteriaceae bacterium]
MKIIECPRDAMQGITKFIPTDLKAKYINQLLQVGFDTIDFGSFVSPKAIPQMRDTAMVYDKLELGNTRTKLLAIVANTRGAMEAVRFEGIHYLGFPFSISETFQQRNTNKSIVEALNTVEEVQDLCKKHGKVLVTYMSMGFGNPYNDPYDVDIVARFADILVTLGIEIISLADTIGVSQPAQITYLFSHLKKQFPQVEFGAHLHSNPATAVEKIEAAYKAGCNRFDGALKGWGGCPMAKDELVGNLATETILDYLVSQRAQPDIDNGAFAKALEMAGSVFSG